MPTFLSIFALIFASFAPNPDVLTYTNSQGEQVSVTISRASDGSPAPHPETGYAPNLARALNEFYYLDAEKNLQKDAHNILGLRAEAPIERRMFGAFMSYRNTAPLLSRSILAAEMLDPTTQKKAVVYALVGSSTHLSTYYMQLDGWQIVNLIESDPDVVKNTINLNRAAPDVEGLDAIQIYQKFAGRYIAAIQNSFRLNNVLPPTFVPIYTSVDERGRVITKGAKEYFLVSQIITNNNATSSSRAVAALVSNDGEKVEIRMLSPYMLVEKLYNETCALRGDQAVKYVNSIGSTSRCMTDHPY